jgi:hypothetical protein
MLYVGENSIPTKSELSISAHPLGRKGKEFITSMSIPHMLLFIAFIFTSNPSSLSNFVAIAVK